MKIGDIVFYKGFGEIISLAFYNKIGIIINIDKELYTWLPISKINMIKDYKNLLIKFNKYEIELL